MKGKFLVVFSVAGAVLAITVMSLAVAGVFDFCGGDENAGQNIRESAKNENGEFFAVARVIDGDTFEVNAGSAVDTVRVIGIDTPEITDPRKSAECFGAEASSKAKEILSGKNVRLESDPAQGERDKYGRLLRYVFLEDGTNFGLLMIRQGYAHEYGYSVSGKYRAEYKEAQNYARENSLGLWGDVCADTARRSGPEKCLIKGNISLKGEKIYHVPGCEYYDKTAVSESIGERWFCSEEEALNAGWRKAFNCP